MTGNAVVAGREKSTRCPEDSSLYRDTTKRIIIRARIDNVNGGRALHVGTIAVIGLPLGTEMKSVVTGKKVGQRFFRTLL